MTKKHKWDKEIRALLDGERVVAVWRDGGDARDLNLFDMRMFDYEGIYFQIKPKTISINGYEFPGPLRVAPELGADYWVVDMDSDCLACGTYWNGSILDKLWLERGIIHSTKEDAVAHAKAIILASGGNID